VRRTAVAAFAATSLALAALGVTGCAKQEADAATVETAAATRQDIVIDVEATGVIAPINAVDVRSKASGQITAMPVETGDDVKPGDLLVRIDPRDAQNRYNQAAASLRAAQASVAVTRAQYTRAQQLAKEGVITAPELESAQLAYANAQAQAAQSRTNLELAQISLEDVTIRAPVAGTVISKSVSLGQVVSSATNSVSGGTALLSLADLTVVYDSTLVTENDIGKVRPGQTATITVDAYPNRTFRGVVEKIEPRATVQQSVTMFPVSIRIENADRALMPGMNTDVSILVQEAPNALAVPIDAVRSPRDARAAATALGLDPASVATLLQGAGRGAGGAGGAGRVPADSARGAPVGQATTAGGAPAGGRQRRVAAGGDSAAGTPRSGGRQGSGGTTMSGAGRGASSRGVVFVRSGTTFEPRLVTLGVANYDVTQVLSGLREGEEVAIVTAAVLQQSRTQQQERIRSRTGLPGMGGTTGGGGGGGTRGTGGGGAGAGGARPSGGGGR